MKQLKYVKLFEQYLGTRGYAQYPMQMVMRGSIGLTSKQEDSTKALMQTIYERFVRLVLVKGWDEYNHFDRPVPLERRVKIDFRYPILNQTGALHAFLKDPRANVYQPVDQFQISVKDIFHKAFKDADFVPKAVFELADIKQLSLPIIAKPSDGHSAEGIEIFDTYEAAQKSKLQFDLWSEAKDIQKEFRAFIFNGRIIHIAERIHNKTDNKAVGKKKPSEKINLVYIDQEIETFPNLQEIEKISKEIGKKVELVLWCIDLMLDKDGNFWVPEINAAPGLSPSMVYSVYKEWVPFAYNGANLSPEDNETFSTIAKTHRENMRKMYPKEYASSLNPMK